ncbi:MAG: PDZ domain-containing protein [Thermodesulfobacteriota bacterium]|nr:PDZ domain-containing protein [Thermodesulfobacteriota bacterium]
MPDKNTSSHSSKSFSLKKISAIIGFIGIIIGAIVGGSKIVQQVQESRGTNKEVKILLEVGDRFAGQFKLNKANDEYQKILEIDKENIDAQRRIIAVMRQKLYLEIGPFPQVNDVLSRIYKVQALNPQLKDDTELLLEEARILIYGDSWHHALIVLENIRRKNPANSEALALGGLGQVLTAPGNSQAGLDLLNQAIEREPNNPLYHFYRAEALEHVEDYSDSIRAFYQAAQLSSGKDYGSYKLHNESILKLDTIFMRFFAKDGALTSHLNLSLDERVRIYEYLVEEYEKLRSRSRSLETARSGYLAMLYYSVKNYEKADHEIRKMFDLWHISYKTALTNWKTETKSIPWVELHIKILEEGGLKPDTLHDARNFLKVYYAAKKKGEEEEKYRKILELTEYGRSYKVGLKVPEIESEEGLIVLHVFKGYPFDKAGIHKGDRILEIAHRKVRKPYDIERVLIKFKLGDTLPLKVKRGDDTLFLPLVLE